MTNCLYQKNLIITTDDFAMSRGVSDTILELCGRGCVNGVSVMTTTNFYQEYITKLKGQKTKDLKVGLHLDLTFGKANSKIKSADNLVVDEKNFFKSSFIKLFLASFFKKKKLMRYLLKEINCQLQTLSKDVENIDYINGHQHIHFIPLIFRITQKLAIKYQIKRIRIINESFISSFNFRSLPSVTSIVKLLILKFCYLINRTKSDVYFYSILYTCKIDERAIINLSKLPYKNIEIMFHPGNNKIDSQDLGNKEYGHLISKYRTIEKQQIEVIKRTIPN